MSSSNTTNISELNKEDNSLYEKFIAGKSAAIINWALFFFGIALVFFPILITKFSFLELDYENTGEIGDIIGGTTAPFLSFVGIVVTFYAFWVQYQSNISQRNDIKLERFENKFYELLSLHKDNINEMLISGFDDRKIEGRKVFVSMYRELRYSYFVAKRVYNRLKDSEILKIQYTDAEILKLAYIFFYTGVGIHSELLYKNLINQSFEKDFYEEVGKELLELHRSYKTLSIDKAVPELELEEIGKSLPAKSYRPYEGHQNRLGHYYRHLFQTVKFVVNQDSKFVPDFKKLEYLKTLRAQLSDHEQVMLYYNSLSTFGNSWIKNGYFTKYKMIHNLPLPLANFGQTPQNKFASDSS